MIGVECLFLAGAVQAFQPAILSVHLDRTVVRPGETIRAVYVLTNLGTALADRRFTVFVHPRLADKPEGTYPMFGADFAPLVSATRWHPHERIEETRPIRIPPDALPGEYRLLIGLYDPDTGRRTPLANRDLAMSDDRYEIARVRVVGPDAQAPAPAPFDRTFMNVRCTPPPVASPSRTFAIRNDEIEAELDAAAPALVSIRDRRTGERFAGALRAAGDDIEICDNRNGPRYVWTPGGRTTLAWHAQPGTDQAAYLGEVRVDGRPAVSLRVVVRLDGNSLTVGFDTVREHPGFQLMQVLLPELCTVTAVDNGHLVIPTESGRDIAAADAGTGEHEVTVNWFDILHVAALYRASGKTAVACKPSGFEDGILARIMPPCAGVGKYAVLGVRLVHRLRATPPAAQFVAQATSGVCLTFVRDMDGNGVADWVDVAKALRRTVTCRPNPLYCNATVYKIMCDVRPHRLVTTFNDALDLIRHIHDLTGGLPQVVYLVGWQHDGHDTGYPDVSVVNPRLGGFERLEHLIREGRKLGAIVSFHDNYDDAYRDSPAWDPDIIARDDHGNLMKGGVWAGRQSYIISAAKYVGKDGLDRVRSTVRHYGITDSTHIDVLSAVPQRHDFNPRAPAGIRETLAGKFAIVREFNRLGVDVTSEGTTEPFIGIMTRFWHLMRNDRQVFIGERRIPFVPFVIHGHAVYGGGQGGFGGLLGAFLYGQTYSADFNKATPEAVMLDLIYLLDLPMQALATREMQRFEPAGNVERVRYSDTTFVEVDWARKAYRIVCDGVTIAQNWTTMVRTKPGAVLVYSRDGGSVACPIPGTPKRIEVRPLTDNGPGASMAFERDKDGVRFTAEPHRPYRVTASFAATD